MPDPTRARVALETTLLIHGVPPHTALPLAQELGSIVRAGGAEPAIVGVVDGQARADLDEGDLERMLSLPDCPKANAANLGPLLAQGATAATTVSATMEIAAAARIEVFATGGLGGVHRNFAQRLDISADLAALARYPVAVVTSGVKSLLDVASSREALESLGVPIVGFATDEFPAFYLRGDPAGPIPIDGRFDDIAKLASFVRSELDRRRRGIVVANPIPRDAELDAQALETWIQDAERRGSSSGITGRALTPAILARLHELSDGATLEANLSLVRENTRIAALLAAAM